MKHDSGIAQSTYAKQASHIPSEYIFGGAKDRRTGVCLAWWDACRNSSLLPAGAEVQASCVAARLQKYEETLNDARRRPSRGCAAQLCTSATRPHRPQDLPTSRVPESLRLESTKPWRHRISVNRLRMQGYPISLSLCLWLLVTACVFEVWRLWLDR